MSSDNLNSDENGMNLRFTKHAEQRSQQRGIPPEMSDLYLEYASWTHSKGARRYSFDKKSRRRLKSSLSHSDYRHYEKWLDCYIVVVREGAIKTIAHRTRRWRN